MVAPRQRGRPRHGRRAVLLVSAALLLTSILLPLVSVPAGASHIPNCSNSGEKFKRNWITTGAYTQAHLKSIEIDAGCELVLRIDVQAQAGWSRLELQGPNDTNLQLYAFLHTPGTTAQASSDGTVPEGTYDLKATHTGANWITVSVHANPAS